MTDRLHLVSPHDFGSLLERTMFGLGIRPLDDHVIFGSAVMKLHGLREEIDDVNLFISQRVYAMLRATRTWSEKRPELGAQPFLEASRGELLFRLFYGWTPLDRWVDPPEAFVRAERVHRVLCVPLELVARYKRGVLTAQQERGVEIAGSEWEKHEIDLTILRAHGVR